MTFSAFSWMKMYEFRLRFHWSLFLSFKLTISQHWFRLWLGAVQATSHYLNQWCYDLLTHKCVTRHQWVKTKSNTIGSLHLMQAMKLQIWHEIRHRFHCTLTHWGRDKMAAFSQTTLSNAFSWMKKLEFRLKINWSEFLRVLLTIFQHWFW